MASQIISAQNKLLGTIKDHLPSSIGGTLDTFNISEKDSRTTTAIKLLAPIVIGLVAAYYAPGANAGAAKYVIKGAIFLVAWVGSGAILGAIKMAAVKVQAFVRPYLQVKENDNRVVSFVKQVALPALIGLATYYFFPKTLILNLSTRQIAVLLASTYSYIVFDRLLYPRVWASVVAQPVDNKPSKPNTDNVSVELIAATQSSPLAQPSSLTQGSAPIEKPVAPTGT